MEPATHAAPAGRRRGRHALLAAAGILTVTASPCDRTAVAGTGAAARRADIVPVADRAANRRRPGDAGRGD